MYLKNYRVSFKLQDTLYIKTVPSFNGEEAAVTLIMAAHNCSRAAILQVQELTALSTTGTSFFNLK